jgi:hypothetical protein
MVNFDIMTRIFHSPENSHPLVAYYKVEELECVFFSERVVRRYGSKSTISFAKK